MSDVHEWDVSVNEEIQSICDWIDSKGGPSGLTVSDLFNLVEGYLGHQTLPFVPTVNGIYGCIEYYLGHIENGNIMTGCVY
jgi:hypothetical protein